MSIPSNFAGLPLTGGTAAAQPKAAGEPWTSPEGIDVLGVYGPEHLEGLDGLDTWPGLSPFLRGPYPTMYTTQPWTILGVTQAQGMVGPPLDGVGGRAIIAGKLENKPDNLMRWIIDPQHVSPGTAMPNLGVSDRDARDISAFLYTQS